jgi:predicted nuclease with RNAse H fold
MFSHQVNRQLGAKTEVVGPRTWLGVDVGGRRKGFDVALIDDRRLLSLRGQLGRDDVLAVVDDACPVLVGVDGPCRCAPPGHRLREDERALRRAVCGIRWTPDTTTVDGSDYYAWIREGLELFDALRARGMAAVEVFPTASWTRWFGPRGAATRSRWSTAGLARLGLEGVPGRTNQDQRDAIAAAVTARQHTLGQTEAMGEIVVPRGLWSGARAGSPTRRPRRSPR